MKLTKLVIHKYRNVAPETSLEFSGERNIFLGRNGAGKTTLLELIEAVLSSVFLRLKTEEFWIEYDVETLSGHLHASIKNERAPNLLGELGVGDALEMRLKSKVPLELSQGANSFVPKIEIEVNLNSGPVVRLRFDGSELTVEPGVEVEDGVKSLPLRGVFDRSTMLDVSLGAIPLLKATPIWDVLNCMVSSIEGGLERFDESLGFLSIIAGAERIILRVVSSKTGTVALPLRMNLTSSVPGLAERLIKEPDLERFDVESTELKLLGRFVELCGFVSGRLKLERLEKRVKDEASETDYGDLGFEFTRVDGSVIGQQLLSYGQKRLLAFYCYLASFPNVVVADELVNGLHHAWIEACLNEMGDRQVFLTSQNPLLLDYLGFESADQVRSSFILCRSEILNGRETLVWSNMTEDEAEGFFDAYQVGIQHVSEILRTRGLW